MQKQKNIICLTPVYNDWESFAILTQNIYKSLENTEYTVSIIAINDGSMQGYSFSDFNKDIDIKVINLKKNVGHQRAIAIGLQYIFNASENYEYIVVLDSDGEDMPMHIKALADKCQLLADNSIIFAQRKKRSESLIFKTGYFFYRYSFKLLTGEQISFGNFSCIPAKHVKRIIYNDNLWNHYSGSVLQSKVPYNTVLLDRGVRYQGQSKMNFTSLVLHGLSSISVYFDSLSIRLLKFSGYSIVLCFISILWIFYIKLFTSSSVPGWASNLLLIIFSIILQFSLLTLIVLLMQLSSRKNITVPSAIIYKKFIEDIKSNKYSDDLDK